MPGSVIQSSKSGTGFSNGIKEQDAPSKTIHGVGKERIIWNKKVPNTELEKFQQVIERKYNKHFESYWDFHKWSVENHTDFWGEIWNYFDFISSRKYDKVLVKTGDGFLDNDWFSGALFNFAENILRHRDDKTALICTDELGNEERITFAQMFEEVQLYAAAFRKNGLKIGDRVTCYMSNRKEAIFAMLATTSIGAIWGGPLPFYGARAASNIVKMMEPKFLVTIDKHQDNDVEFRTIDNLAYIVQNTPSLEKVVIVTTTNADISHVPKSVSLEEFLESGRTADGAVPKMVFEQLPPDHPICINFTSGTTGLPKGPVHSAACLLSELRDFAFHLNLRSGDVILTYFPVGWSLWDTFIPPLALGVTVILYEGSVYKSRLGRNIWDQFSDYGVKFSFLVTSIVDKLEKMNIVPSSDSNLDCLKIIGVGGSPVKRQNFEYLRNKVKEDVFVGSMYGATEVFGAFSGFSFNSPAFGGEIQAPALATDIQCFNSEGRSVIGERGELVIATPSPCFPVYLWKDTDRKRLTNIYLSRFKGVWSQNDECWINPQTHGIVVIGRSDDTLKQNGERFGSTDIYFAIHGIEELEDYVCVNQDGEEGDCRAVLFVKCREGVKLTPDLTTKIENTIQKEFWEDYVPKLILQAPDIPYNLNNKRMESTVRQIIANNKIPKVNNIRNPDCLQHFLDIPEILSYNKKHEFA